MTTSSKSIGAEARDYVSEAREKKASAMAEEAFNAGITANQMRWSSEGQWLLLWNATQLRLKVKHLSNKVPSWQTQELMLLKLDWLEAQSKPGRIA